MWSRGYAWPLAAVSCAVMVAGVALLWVVKPGLGMSVGIPAGATLIAAVITWAGSAPPRIGQSTLEQLERAKQALADCAVDQLCGVARPERNGMPLPALSRTLPVRWAASTPSEIDDTPRDGTDDVVMMAARLRDGQSRRLIILGSPGCGKTTLARLLMAELLGQLKPADPVPVFLQFTAWNPEQYSLREWIAREICEVVPELQYKSSYGSTAVESLISHGKVLPILDGFDAIPETLRRSVLASDDFLQLPQLILTCRTQDFRTVREGASIADATIFTPGYVRPGEAEEFLRNSASEPAWWSNVFQKLSSDPDGYLALALSKPQVVYLAEIAYKDSNPEELITGLGYSKEDDVEGRILMALPRALLPPDGQWAPSCPWYHDKAIGWVRYLANTVSNPDTHELAWGSIFRAVPGFYRRKVAVRAIACSLAAVVLIALFNRYRGGFTLFGWLTGAAYGLAIAMACIFLSPPNPGQHDQTFRRPAYRWWIHHKWAESSRIITASIAAALLFGTTIILRARILHGSHPYSTGVVDGLVAGMVVALSAVIARIPSAPRSGPSAKPPHSPDIQPIDTGIYSLSTWTSVAIAAGLGLLFGLASGVLALIEHSGDSGSPHIAKGLAFGIIMGLNFAMGAWLVGLAHTRTISSRLPDPWATFRAERRFALLAMLILGLTFASAFSLNSSLGWSRYSAIPEGVVGVIAGSLVSEWPLYVAAVTIVALRRELPLRLMKFLELCRSQGALQPIGTTYRFHEVAPWVQPTGSEAESPIAAGAGSLAPGMAPTEGTGAFGWRVARSYLASPRMLGCTLVLAACALSMRVALHWIPPSGLASRELPLVFVAGAAAVIGFGVGVPFSGQGHFIGRQLPGLQLAAVVGMVCAAVALFAAGAASAHLADGTPGMVRNLAGLTGVALLSAAAFGGPLAWVMPMAYSLVTLYALEHAWTTPWIWPARPSRDIGAALCAALIFAAGIAVISARGARSDPSPRPGHV